MYSKLVSVIIPVFNASNYIEACLDSVLNQTYKSLQVIIVNDGSTDNSLDTIQQFIKNDDRFIVINQENRGCSAAKNKGLEFVKGDYVQYLDADDILSNDKIELQVQALTDNNYSIAVCKTIIFKNHINDVNLEIDTDLISKAGSGKDFIYRLWGSEGKIGMVQPNAYLVPINIIVEIGKWDESLSPSPDEDGEYFARVLRIANSVLYTNGINHYRKLNNVSSLSKETSFKHALGLLQTIKKKFYPFLYEDFVNSAKLYSFQLTMCAYQFGSSYPQILNLVEDEFKKWGIKGYSFVSASKFSYFSQVIGFRNALKLKSFLSSL
jgi:glycosyltransferase involved in cell wall biosynthesis